MTMEYKLLAADMDGTALSDSKELGPRTVEAMERAIANGKTVVFSTGRSISLIRPYIDMVSGMRYAVTSSGASVMDLKNDEKLLYKTIEPETVKYIIAQSSGRYVMPVMFMDDKSYGTRWCVDNCADFGLKAYEPIYRKCMNIVDDAFNYYMEDPKPIEKLNLFFANDYEAFEVLDALRELPVTFTCVTEHSVEINASGVSKAEGLKVLCSRLGISMSECIAAGDSENDEPMLACAGLKVATANATKRVKIMADVIAPDCNNEPIAQIIDEYLLA